MTKSKYNDVSAILLADSISDIDSRLSTFLVCVPPADSYEMRELPGVVATPIHIGMTKDEVIAHCLDFLDTPYTYLGDVNPFGGKMLKAEWQVLIDKVQAYLQTMGRTADAPHRELVWSIISPFVPHHYMMTSTNWAALLDGELSDCQLVQEIATVLALQSEPVPMKPDDNWHMPWVTTAITEEIVKDGIEAKRLLGLTEQDTYERSLFQAQLVSFARCARGGPMKIDGEEMGLQEELERARAMQQDNCWWRYRQAAAHIATPDWVENRQFTHLHCHGEYFGWNQFKWLFHYAKKSQEVIAKNNAFEKAGETLARPKLKLIEGGLDG